MAQPSAELREQRQDLMKRGLWRDVVTLYREQLSAINDDKSGEDLRDAVDALRNLREWAEFDGLVENAVASHAENPKLLAEAAAGYWRAPHRGRLIAGEFERDASAGYAIRRAAPGADPVANAGETVFTDYRDFVRSLQLVMLAQSKAVEVQDKVDIWQDVEGLIGERDDWKLQTLTPLDALPEWSEPGPNGGTEGAPWKDGKPVLYQIPESWDAAKNDGERLRFALDQQVKLDENNKARVIMIRARKLQQEFSIRSLNSYQRWGWQDPEQAKSILEVETLADDECLAETSDGVKRFKLSADYHFIALYRSILDDKGLGGDAGDALVSVYLDRLQLKKAEECLEQVISKHGPGPEDSRKKLLEQITGDWGQFNRAESVAHGSKVKLPLVFRNARELKLTAAPVDVESVLKDAVSYLKSNPNGIDYQMINIANVANRLIHDNESKYIGEVAKSWDESLKPLPDHRETYVELEVPVEDSGAWWITAETADGHPFNTLVWIVDTVVMHKDVDGKKQWWAVDAATGEPVAGAEFEFFGFRTVPVNKPEPQGRKMNVLVKEFSRVADAEGKVLLNGGDWDRDYQWMTVAKSEGRKSAYSGFLNYYLGESGFENGNRDISYGISDRPLYQPGDTVHLKFYLRNVGYFNPEDGKYANLEGTLTLYNGRGDESVKLEKLKTDAMGTVEAETVIPRDAALGEWRARFEIVDKISTSMSFRVEEYRKPEYEVTVEAPDAPVKLGETFTAKVKATYFHGAPVRNARVEITVKRKSLGERWFPLSRWDWLYGPGAWWPQAVASWHPSWASWRCFPPSPPWQNRGRWTPDELVLQKTTEIGPDGTVEVVVDTAAALQAHGDMDAKYVIEARVVDASRREESGTGEVIAARKPFEVVVWTERGFSAPGDDVVAQISAATLAGKPVVGAKGTLALLKLNIGDDGRVEETEVSSWPVETNAEGKIEQKFQAPAAGQYRLSAKLSLDGGEVTEGGAILNVYGSGAPDTEHWKFGDIELLTDKQTYAPGETLKLRVNSDHADASVWLFIHMAGNSGREAKLVKLDGKSLEVPVPLDARDMPNMFIEAVTVFNGEVHSTEREVLLPPVSKLIDVSLEPAANRVQPQAHSSIKLTLKDAAGNPIRGKAALTIYDKALEAIAGGSNVGPINENFWGWKNEFYGYSIPDSIPIASGNLVRDGSEEMVHLGYYADAGIRTQSRSLYGRQRYEFAESDADPFAASPATPMMARGGAMAKGAEMAAAPEIHVRKDFADLLKWSGEIETDENGQAEIPLEFPDNLTTWKARVWAMADGTQVGEGTAEIITSKELLVRLQAPRFLVEGDEAVLSAVVHNDHSEAKSVTVSLELDGEALELVSGESPTVEMAAMSEKRVDWKVKALHAGEATLRMKVTADDDGDAVERQLPVLVHGISKQEAWSRVVTEDQESAAIDFEVPDKRRPEESKLTIRFSPTVAGAVVDAIPYLADYPHGCTEQTLNRFVPAAIARKMLTEMGVNLAEIRAKRINLNPQQLGSGREKEWQQWQRNPVFDEAELDRMISTGLDRLAGMQNADGGWGWFSGYGEHSYPHTTALIVHGLLAANQAGVDIPSTMLDPAIGWLIAYERHEAEALQRYVENQALRAAGKKVPNKNLREKVRCDAVDAFVRYVLGQALRNSEPMAAFLYRDRLDLPVYAQCLLGLEQNRMGDVARRDEMLEVVSQFLKQDAENQTAYLDLNNQTYWWYWYGSEVEANAWYLKLLAAVKPKDSVARGVAKYLVNNRRQGSAWKSTRDTAFAVEAIADYFTASGEGAPEMKVEVLVDGNSLRTVEINRDNLFDFDGTIVLSGEQVPGGKHQIELRRSGKGTLYANAYLQVFTMEDQLKATGLEVKVQRRVSRLIPLEKETETPDSTGLVTHQLEQRFRREVLKDGDSVKSGDRIEVELILESKNDYEYLLFSDAKAAGFEPLEALSGYVPGSTLNAYMEPRNESVNFYIRSLPRGKHTLRYQLRAEAPGTYKALPAMAEGMYAPELRANSDDIRLKVGE
ncbi:hypothetical protein JIN85_01640 [Luteolibacter pohnpeiensis]|uniref:Alpha-2-macroglobulin n=1 Tax=Luteolibacter pohnpeiensis TaxID=454153 RepID=A0A934S0P1_9BACT|nr:MG2 domain-containing protein [Luteolibacter pohnpeiensis]MBK1881095.1 hypothetical protein [Luteolibacter pohnpeiensis]